MIAFSVGAGLLRGMIRTLFGLAGLFCGLGVAAWQYAPAAEWVRANGWIASPQIARGVCYVVIAALVMIAFAIVGAIARRTAHAVGLGMLDRLLGGVLGAARGVLIGAAIVLGIKSIAPHSELMRGSRLSSYFLAAAHAVSFVVPHSFR